jgi:hypothetical protein
MKLYKKIITNPDNDNSDDALNYDIGNNNAKNRDIGDNFNNNNDKYNNGDNRYDDNEDNNDYKLICSELLFADNFFSRLFGLIFKNLKNNQGFVIENCNSIHTFWMRYKIDLIFLNKNNEIVKLYESFKQFRLTPLIKNAVKVIELPVYTIKSNSLKKGDILKIS